MSTTQTLLSAAARLQDLPHIHKVERSTWELDFQAEDERIQKLLPGEQLAPRL